MIFYEIELVTPLYIHTDLPTFPPYDRANLLKLTVVREGQALYEYPDGTSETVTPATFCASPVKAACTPHQAGGDKLRDEHIWLETAYTYRIHDTDDPTDYFALKERVRLGETVLIPRLVPLREKYEMVLQLYGKVASLIQSPTPSDCLRMVGAGYSLLAVLTDLVINVLDKTHISLPLSTLQYANDAKAYIAEHYSKPLHVEEIAAHLGISAGYLHTIFKEVTSLSLMDYVNRYRVEQACTLITSTSLTLREISELVGISDPAYMSRLFKKITGLSFTEYKKKEGHSIPLHTSCT